MGQTKIDLLLDMTVNETAEAVDFYTKVFDAVQIGRECLLDGQLVQAELVIGEYVLVLSAWSEAAPARRPGVAAATTPLSFESDDVDSLLRRAVAAGARIGWLAGDVVERDAAEGPVVHDPAGLRWTIHGSHTSSHRARATPLPGTATPDRGAGHCDG
jgi:PhnB protein